MEGAEVLVRVAPPTGSIGRWQAHLSLARALENEELATSVQGDHPAVPCEAAAAAEVFASPEDCSDDHALALLLQAEYDREHDTVLGVEEKNSMERAKLAIWLIGPTKLAAIQEGLFPHQEYLDDHRPSLMSVSFDNYRRAREPVLSDSEDEDEDDGLDGGLGLGGNRHWDSFERDQRAAQAIGRSGVARQPGGGFTTKHDATVCGRRNACRVMELPPGISTGDGGGFDMRLSNHVYNSLKVHSAQEGRRAARLHDKREKATAEQSLDPNTRLVLYKLLNREILYEMNGCISTGKESCVFYAVGGKTEEFKVPPGVCSKGVQDNAERVQESGTVHP
ncbi:hypothetical protein MRX96_034265 [Rhipicephalus microplus]